MFDIDTALKAISARHEENREEFDKFQSDFRAANAMRLNPNSDDAKKARAVQQEDSITKEILFLTQEPDSELKKSRLYQALDRLSELLAEQGDFEKAISVCPNEERKQYFQSLNAE